MTSTLLGPLLAFAICAGMLTMLMALAHHMPHDQPNERSLHQQPVPRIGGLGIAGGITGALIATGTGQFPELWVSAAVLAFLSWFDDLRGLPIGPRLAAHFAAATLTALALGLTGWELAIAILLWVWITNLFNFMDGADGLAGGMAVIGFAALAWGAHFQGDGRLALACLVVAMATAGFLPFNFPPARLFMGDAGSIPLGFLAAGLGLAGWRSGTWPAAFPLLIFSPFIADATSTLARRAWAREKPWQAHRDHYYQRLVRLGWSHRQLAMAEYALMATSSGSAWVLLARPDATTWILGIWSIAYLVLAWLIDNIWRRSEA